jgi:phenolic acid decarboxylase
LLIAAKTGLVVYYQTARKTVLYYDLRTVLPWSSRHGGEGVSRYVSKAEYSIIIMGFFVYRASWRDPSGVTDTGRTLNIGKKAFGIESNLTPLISESTRYVTKINFTINT